MSILHMRRLSWLARETEWSLQPLANSLPVRPAQSQDTSVALHCLGQGFVLNLSPVPSHLRLCVLPFFQLCSRC